MAKEKKSAGTPVFIETGVDWFKIIQFEHSARGLQVSRMCLEKFEVAGSALSSAIAAAYKKHKFPKCPVISCLPRHMVNIRIMELPSVDSDEINDMVGFQAGRQTPYSKDEILYDYKIIGGGREGYTRVVLVIAQRSILRQKYSILEEAGIEIERMSVSSEGLLNWCNHLVAGKDGAGAAVIVDVDSFYSDFMVISGGAPVFTRSILIGADHLLKDYESASGKFVREIEQSLEICRGESPDLAIGSIFLSGAAPRMEGLADVISGQTGVPVQNRDCLSDISKMPSSPSFSSPEYKAVSVTPLVGMAMARDVLEFNLVPDSVRLRKELVGNARKLTAFGILVMSLLVSSSVYLTSRLFFEENRLAMINRLVSETGPQARKVVRQAEVVAAARSRREVDFAAFNLLAEIHGQVPDGAYFDEIDINVDDSRILLVGTVAARGDVRTIVQQLEKTKVFENVESSQSAKVDDRFSFQITCSLERKK